MRYGPKAERVIRCSSTALGYRVTTWAFIYPDLETMRSAAEAFNGQSVSDALAVTQCWTWSASERVVMVFMRLVRGHLGTQIVTHEMHHVSTALYGASVGDRISRKRHLTNRNEPFAHLHSDLVARLVDQLHAHGYYGGSK